MLSCDNKNVVKQRVELAPDAPKEKIKNKNKRKKTVGRVVFRFFLVVFTFVFLSVGGLLGALMIVEFGPSEKARDLFVVSMMETSAAQFLATSFLGQEKVDEIMAANAMRNTDDITDTELVVIGSDNVGKDGVKEPCEIGRAHV